MLALLLENCYTYRLSDQWAGVWQIDRRPLLGVAFSAMALGSLASPRWWQILLDNAPMRFLAAISYNLYLYHQIVARELVWHHIPPYTGNPHHNAQWQAQYTGLAFAASHRGCDGDDLSFRTPATAAEGTAPSGRSDQSCDLKMLSVRLAMPGTRTSLP